MKKTFSQIVAEIDSHLEKSQKEFYSDFYVGITNDVERRLFTEHNVQKMINGGFIEMLLISLLFNVLRNII